MPDLLSEHACFGGVQRFHRHDARAIGLPMRFSVYLPPAALLPGAEGRRLPLLFYLAGLTCTEETFMIKAGAQRAAAREGLILVAPDTSPRGANLPGESDSWDFGLGAGFYVDASVAPWSRHYRMYSYILELRELVLTLLPADPARIGIFGHSMAGTAPSCWHCAILTCSARCPRSRRLPRPAAVPGAGKRSAATLAPTRRPGATTTPPS